MTNIALTGELILLKAPPAGIKEDLQITFDEIMLYDCDITVRKFMSQERSSMDVKIIEACRYHKKKHLNDLACHTVSISSHDQLNQLISMPDIIREKSFYCQYWPNILPSNYLKQNSHLFYTFWEGYSTPPTIAYGGATEWLYIQTGRLEITLIEPTENNLYRYSTLDEDDELDAEPNTTKTVLLKDKFFIIIPAGKISIKKALKGTVAFGGELFHGDNLQRQLESFEDDVAREARVSLDRDSEIRQLHWFYAAHLLATSAHHVPSYDILKAHLKDWKLQMKKHAIANPYLPPTLYAPTCLDIDALTRDIHSKWRSHRKGESKLPREGTSEEATPKEATSIEATLDDATSKKGHVKTRALKGRGTSPKGLD